MEEKQLPIYKASFNKNNGNELQFISLVQEPAIEIDFIKLRNEKKLAKIAFSSDEKQVVTGPVLVPDQLIYRKVKEKGKTLEYYITFDAQTIRQVMEQSIKERIYFANLEHSGNLENQVFFTENWIKESSQDKSVALGFDLPNGTWFASAKVESPELWQRVKDGEFNGFSIEGFFDFVRLDFSKLNQHHMDLNKIMMAAIQASKSLKLATLPDGMQIFPDEEGMYYVLPAPGTEGTVMIAPDGEHTITFEDGTEETIVIAEGKRVEAAGGNEDDDEENPRREEMEELEKERDELKSEVEELKKQKGEIETQLAKVKKEGEETAKKLADSKKKIKSLEDAKTKLSTEKETLSKKVDELAMMPGNDNKKPGNIDKNTTKAKTLAYNSNPYA